LIRLDSQFPLFDSLPPVDWSIERKREYFDWTERVIAGVRGTNAPLEALYDDVLARARSVLAVLEALDRDPV
jgi:hypothetical protein